MRIYIYMCIYMYIYIYSQPPNNEITGLRDSTITRWGFCYEGDSL